MTKPPKNVLDLPLEERATMALRIAVEKVIIEHARLGLPICIWRDGKVFEVPPEELKADAERTPQRVASVLLYAPASNLQEGKGEEKRN